VVYPDTGILFSTERERERERKRKRKEGRKEGRKKEKGKGIKVVAKVKRQRR
jgi:hypothetical protein